MQAFPGSQRILLLLSLLGVAGASPAWSQPNPQPASCSRQSGLPAGIARAASAPRLYRTPFSDRAAAGAVFTLVGAIETGRRDPYTAITANFDAQGLSLGILQYNFGGSAQAVFGPIPDTVFAEKMPMFGTAFRTATLTAGRDAAVPLVTTLQHQVADRRGRMNWALLPQAETELRAFLGTPESRAAQNAAAEKVLEAAHGAAIGWARSARGADRPTPREVAFFFDLQVFNGGGMEGVWVDQARTFRGQFSDDGAMIAYVATWLASCRLLPNAQAPYGVREGASNGALWTRSHPPGTRLSDEPALLFAHGFLRAMVSNGPPGALPEDRGVFKTQVVSRRGMIALGLGTANGVPWPGRPLAE